MTRAPRPIRWTVRAQSELDALNDAPDYFDAVVDTVERAALFPLIGPMIPGRKNVHKVLSGKHYVYYRNDESEMVVLRITHTSRQHGHLIARGS